MIFLAMISIFVIRVTSVAPVDENIAADNVVVISNGILIRQPAKFSHQTLNFCTPGTSTNDGCNSCYCSEGENFHKFKMNFTFYLIFQMEIWCVPSDIVALFPPGPFPIFLSKTWFSLKQVTSKTTGSVPTKKANKNLIMYICIQR